MSKHLRKKSQEALDFLEKSQDLTNFISWSAATEMLAQHFGWTAKTASNRIHELIEVGALERVGNFERPTPREPNGVDNRKIRRAK